MQENNNESASTQHFKERTHFVNTASCWRVDGPFTVYRRGYISWISSEGYVADTPAVPPGKIKIVVALSDDQEKPFFLDEGEIDCIRKGIGSDGPIFWKQRLC